MHWRASSPRNGTAAAGVAVASAGAASAAPGHDLRPRTPAELYDAAWNLMLARPGLLGALGSLHSVPFALGLGALFFLPGRAFVLSHPSLPLGVLAAFTAASVALRPIALGATAVAVSVLVGGEEPDAADCVRRALARAADVVAVSARVLLLDLITLGLFRVGGTRHTLAPLVVLEGRHPEAARKEATRLAQGFTVAHASLNLHGALLFFVAFVNLWAGALVGVEAGRILFGLDLNVLRGFISPRNPSFAVLLVFATGFALEPVRAVVKSLMFLDLRLREEGTDLKLRLARLG